MNAFRTGAGLLLCVTMLGCATRGKPNADRDWNSLQGSYTYQEAVTEFGRPAVVGGQSDGSQFAEWITKRSPQFSFGLGMGHGSYGRRGGVGVGAGTTVSPPAKGEYLRLSFDPDGKLNGWTRVRH